MTTTSLLFAVCFISAVAIPSVAFARDQTCHPVTKQEIAGLFDRWNQSLKTQNPDKVVANYASHSILLATVSNKPRLTLAEKKDYFKHFLLDKPIGHVDFRDIMIGCNSAVDTGLYRFTFANSANLKARYTFAYEWNGKQWLIAVHHSSKMPEPE